MASYKGRRRGCILDLKEMGREYNTPFIIIIVIVAVSNISTKKFRKCFTKQNKFGKWFVVPNIAQSLKIDARAHTHTEKFKLCP